MAKKRKKTVFTWKTLFNKYALAILFFVVWISFVDQHNLITQYRLSSALSEMDDKCAHYKDQIKETQDKREQIENDREKFAREKYYMKRANEDVFVIEQEKK